MLDRKEKHLERLRNFGTTSSDGSPEDDRAEHDARSEFMIYGPKRRTDRSASDDIPFGGIALLAIGVWLYMNPSVLVFIALLAVGFFFLWRYVNGMSQTSSNAWDDPMADMRRRAQEQMDQEREDR